MFRLIYKKFLGTVLNVHFAMYFVVKACILPMSMMANVALLMDPDVNTEQTCDTLKITLGVETGQTVVMVICNIIFRLTEDYGK